MQVGPHAVFNRPMTDHEPTALTCTFCGKGATEVRSMVAGGNGYICDECVRSAVEMIAGEHPDWASSRSQRWATRPEFGARNQWRPCPKLPPERRAGHLCMAGGSGLPADQLSRPATTASVEGMMKSDVQCLDCGAGYRRIELSSRSSAPGHYRCLVCDRLIETFDGSKEVAYRLTVHPERPKGRVDKKASH